jgi:fluoride exporter
MKQIVFNSAIVGIGGFVGSVFRYGLTLALQQQSLVMPAGTLAANLAGCFIIGCVAELAAPLALLSPEARLLLGTGFCGGFTTMSSMVYELAQFLRDGEYLHAGFYFCLTLAGSIVLFFLGSILVKLIIRSTGGIWN